MFKTEHFYSQTAQGPHKIVYNDWGDESGRPIVCVHGLTGNAHDFDGIAPALVDAGYRVIAPDLPGRGRSDYLSNPIDYHYGQYCVDLMMLLHVLGLSAPGAVDWLGVSLGGIAGMMIASGPQAPIKRLILNDIGAVVTKQAIDHLKTIFATDFKFNDRDALGHHFRTQVRSSWGPLSEDQWAEMVSHCAKENTDGTYVYAYDPAITRALRDLPSEEVDLFAVWDALTCPVLVIRGGLSMLLTSEIVERMKGRGPVMSECVFSDCGHVPSLWAPAHIDTVCAWLNKEAEGA